MLIVEDSRSVAQTLEAFARRLDLCTVHHETAEDALAWLDRDTWRRERRLVCALVDLHLPGQDGTTFAREFHARVGRQAILMTGGLAPEHFGGEVLLKPFGLQDLYRALWASRILP